MTDRPDLVEELLWLTARALQAGADPGRVHALVKRLLAQDPRTARVAELAERARRAYEAGTDIPALMERFGRSRATIHRWLAVSRSCETSLRDDHDMDYHEELTHTWE